MGCERETEILREGPRVGPRASVKQISRARGFGGALGVPGPRVRGSAGPRVRGLVCVPVGPRVCVCPGGSAGLRASVCSARWVRGSNVS